MQDMNLGSSPLFDVPTAPGAAPAAPAPAAGGLPDVEQLTQTYLARKQAEFDRRQDALVRLAKLETMQQALEKSGSSIGTRFLNFIGRFSGRLVRFVGTFIGLFVVALIAMGVHSLIPPGNSWRGLLALGIVAVGTFIIWRLLGRLVYSSAYQNLGHTVSGALTGKKAQGYRQGYEEMFRLTEWGIQTGLTAEQSGEFGAAQGGVQHEVLVATSFDFYTQEEVEIDVTTRDIYVRPALAAPAGGPAAGLELLYANTRGIFLVASRLYRGALASGADPAVLGNNLGSGWVNIPNPMQACNAFEGVLRRLMARERDNRRGDLTQVPIYKVVCTNDGADFSQVTPGANEYWVHSGNIQGFITSVCERVPQVVELWQLELLRTLMADNRVAPGQAVAAPPQGQAPQMF